MAILRTPDERFAELSGYGFEPHYAEVDALRIHYVDEGAGPVVLLMHGEPTWSYLYRKMIPLLVDAGLRAIAPDLVGFGRSDKLDERTDYTYKRHVGWMHGFLRELDLREITLFGQDWGGLIGLRLVGEDPGRFSAVVVSNTGLPRGDGPMSEAFLKWRELSQSVPEFPAGLIVGGACREKLTPEEIAAYDAPFPDESFKEGARQFPLLVPVDGDDPAVADQLAAWETLERFDKPFLTAFGDSDPITGGGDAVFQRLVPGAKGQPHRTIAGGGHFIQEDRPQECVQAILDVLGLDVLGR